jgi:hypothetical protein
MTRGLPFSERGIDAELRQLREECPILLDQSFLKRFPGVWNVASFIYAQRRQGTPPALTRAGVETMSEYLENLRDGDEKALEIYNSAKFILGW